MSYQDWGHRMAASVVAWAATNETVQQVTRNIPSWVNVTNIQLVLMATKVISQVNDHLPEPLQVENLPELPEDPVTEDLGFEAARDVGDVIEQVTPDAEVEVPRSPGPETSTEIGGPQVDAQIAEIKALQSDHEAQLKKLDEARDAELKDRAEKDTAWAENQFRGIDLGAEGLRTLAEAQAANQQQIKDRYEVEKTNLRQQQGVEMAALQAKQLGAPPPPPQLPPPPPPPTRGF